MKLSELKQRSEVKGNGKLAAAYAQFEKLLNELAKKGLPDEIIPSINEAIDALNSITESGKTLKHQIRKKQSAIIKLVEKRLKIVPKNYYRNLWLSFGMAAFGIPLGVAFGVSLDNMALLGIGIPIGLAIGIGVGTAMDQKAAQEGRQLDIEIQI
jgi:hypothetical protein